MRSLVTQKSITSKLDALHGRAEPLLARVRLEGEIEARRFATRLTGLDPLALFRSGPGATVDVFGKVITGVEMDEALRYRAEDGGPLAPPEALIAGVTLRGSNLRVFLDCNFQGADLAVGELGARVTMAGARFLRCDLRWSRWENRTLAGVRFVGCKLHGVLGAPHFDGVIIDDPDLSADGDRSWTGSIEDVLALWNQSANALPVNKTPHEEAS